MRYTAITIEKVPKKLLDAYKNTAEPIGVSPEGLTLVPTKVRGYQTVEVFILEKMPSHSTTRQVFSIPGLA